MCFISEFVNSGFNMIFSKMNFYGEGAFAVKR